MTVGKKFAWGAGELCSPRTIAGGFGNPFRVPVIIDPRRENGLT
jgi:hypothetical protein